jgi:hypothetical protein
MSARQGARDFMRRSPESELLPHAPHDRQALQLAGAPYWNPLQDGRIDSCDIYLFGRGLPPVASAQATLRYWRPQVRGRQALVVGYSRRAAVATALLK